jgi:hypothetical protein
MTNSFILKDLHDALQPVGETVRYDSLTRSGVGQFSVGDMPEVRCLSRSTVTPSGDDLVFSIGCPDNYKAHFSERRSMVPVLQPKDVLLNGTTILKSLLLPRVSSFISEERLRDRAGPLRGMSSFAKIGSLNYTFDRLSDLSPTVWFDQSAGHEQMRFRFRGKCYRDVLALAEKLKYPDRITESERQMLEIAPKRTDG